jgi:hypothetical protein
MATEWLLDNKRFCIAPNGDYAGNDDTCYWGLPSIQASDPAYPPLGYWRGYIWGPMAQVSECGGRGGWREEGVERREEAVSDIFCANAQLAAAQLAAQLAAQWKTWARIPLNQKINYI